jgi:hypothetical protein
LRENARGEVFVKVTARTLPAQEGFVAKRVFPFLLLVLFCSVPLARAQRGSSSSSSSGPGPYNFALGFGTWQDPSNGQGIENQNSINEFGSCTPSPADPTCQTNPALSHFFMGFDGDAMLNKRFGFGGELTFTPGRSNYGPLLYRQEFYDFNGLFEPYSNKHMALRVEGGIGGAHTGFAVSGSECAGVAVCSNYVESFAGANHFQEHASVGVQIYLTHNIFIRPQFDYRNVSNFTTIFGRDSVLQGGVWVGYNFGTF